jgi:hypothetical protein
MNSNYVSYENDYVPFIKTTTTINTCNTIKLYNRGPIMSEVERLHIRDWAMNLFSKNGINNKRWRRFEYTLHKYPNEMLPLVSEIEKRISIKHELVLFKKKPILADFLTVIPSGGYIQKHVDPNDWKNGLFHIRFNVFISLPKIGGTTYYDGNIVDVVEGAYVLCRSGIDIHWTDDNKGPIPRISLSFGYLLPPEKVDELCKYPEYGMYKRYYPLTLHKPIQPNLNDFKFDERGPPNTRTNVFTIADVFTSTQCELIVDFFMSKSESWKEIDVMSSARSNLDCNFLTVKKFITPGSIAEEIDNLIFKRINAVLAAFRDIRPDFKGIRDDGYTLCKIYGGTKRHVDGVHSKVSENSNFVRAMSLIIVLNDDYDGGIFNFPAQNLKFKVKKGEVVMFPPYWTHPHSVTSVGEGQARYTINTWILEKFVD